jgi:hypothetical protein
VLYDFIFFFFFWLYLLLYRAMLTREGRQLRGAVPVSNNPRMLT